MIFAIAAISIFIAMVLVLYRLYAGPTLYDRVLSVNAFGTYTVLLIGILGYVVSYILGGSTAIYFALRRDVDGTEDSEIYIEGADDDD